MANTWRIAAMGWGMTFLTWFLSPIIGILVKNTLSYLGFEASGKLRDLKIHTIPKLKSMLREAVGQKMMKAAANKNSDVVALDELAKELRSALYEAEDILDLVDYHRLEKEVRGDSSWLRRSLQYLKDAAGSCIARCNRSCFGRYIRTARCRLAALLRWIQTMYAATATRIAECYPSRRRSWLRRCMRVTLRTSTAILPISRPRSDSSVQRLRCCSRIIFKNRCRSIPNWSAKAIKGARSFPSWFHEKVGIITFQEDVIAEDSCLPTIARRSLSKRIERLANNVIKLQESHLLKQESSCAPASNSIANMNRRSITATVTREVFGRDNERDEIIKMLREGTDDSSTTGDCSTSPCYSVIGIYGIAGSGKTTLAEYVRDYEKEAKYFDPIMCIHVSETFSVDDIFRDMLKEITNDRHPNIKDRKKLQDKLQENLKNRRFFLVLDDLWNENRQELEELLSPLSVGETGSKILVTARRENTVRALGAKKPIAIPDLGEDQYFKMFMHYADKNDREYDQVGRKIAEKLRRSPIAAVTVAGRLRGIININKWRITAELDQLNETMGALWWSYQQLDADVRRCFEYCSIFPRRYKLGRDELVRMWIAQGFVMTNNVTDDMEDVGHRYCDELLSCSFLQLRSAATEYFTVHDLLRDLVEKVAGSDCFRIENGWTGEVPGDVRHLFVTTCNRALLAEKIFKLKNLRTLIIDSGAMIENFEDKDFESMFTGMRKLRILSVEVRRQSSQFSVPASIGQLKHIRYLAIKTGYFFKLILPGTFTKLYHMKVLDFGSCRKLVFYPGQDMSNLINLRHILTLSDLNLPNIISLTSLQTLPILRVRKKLGYELRQLRDLNKLRGRLVIRGLQNVGSKEEALEANLAGKERITELHLTWGGNVRRCSAELQAPSLTSLKTLPFFPVRKEPGYELRQLRENKLRGRLLISELANVGSKEEALEANLADRNRVQEPGQSAGAQAELAAVRGRSSLWSLEDVRGRSSADLEAEILDGICCPMGLETLVIDGYKGSRYPDWMVTYKNGPKHLQRLVLRKCSRLGAIPDRNEFFVHLRGLALERCNWDALPDNMEHLTSLKELSIVCCRNIRSLPTLPRSLEYLKIRSRNDLFTRSCKTIGDPNWQKIEHVPKKDV